MMNGNNGEEPTKSGSTRYSNPLESLEYLTGKAKDIMERKNHDYRGGSGDPYANFRGSVHLSVSPVTGILLRVQDKLMRIKTFDEKRELKVKGEGLEDALIDVINYMALIHGITRE